MKDALSLLKTSFYFIKSGYADIFRLARYPRKGLKSLYGVSLYRNAVYLIVGTAITNVTGFVFWIIAARLYLAEAVGLGSAILSALGLLAIFSGLGLEIGLIRFLPGAGKDRNDMVNSCFTLSGLASVAVALIFLAGLRFWSPALLVVRQDPIFFTAFIIFAAATTLQPLISGVFLAKLNTKFIVIVNIIACSLKIALVLVFAMFFTGAFGIFVSTGLATAIALLFAAFWFLPKAQNGYRPLPRIEKRVLNELSHYAAGNYVGGIILFMTSYVLPLAVINILGAEMNAYFYIAWMVAGTFQVIPSSISNSLFAEGSNDEASIRTNTAKSLRFTFLLLLPLTILILIIAGKLLLLFGQAYADNAALLLRILVVAVIPWGINYLYVSIERVRKNIKGIITVAAVATCLSLGLSYLLMLKMGLVGVGVGYVAGQTIVAIAVFIHLWRRYSHIRVLRKAG
jgi:O-antigen/teichoic acid export membrane protein